MLEHIYGNTIAKPLNENSTNLRVVKDMKTDFDFKVDSLSGQRNAASGKRFEEPQEILKYFENFDNNISVEQAELKCLKDTFEEFAELLQYILNSTNLKLFPVGSFVIGCVRKNHFTVDSYLQVDQTDLALDCQQIISMFEEKKMSSEVPTQLFYNFTLSLETDPVDSEQYILFLNTKKFK